MSGKRSYEGQDMNVDVKVVRNYVRENLAKLDMEGK